MEVLQLLSLDPESQLRHTFVITKNILTYSTFILQRKSFSRSQIVSILINFLNIYGI